MHGEQNIKKKKKYIRTVYRYTECLDSASVHEVHTAKQAT